MIKIKNMNVLILAGGKGSRMNFCNKALLKKHDKTFLENLKILFSDFNKIYLSLNSSQNIEVDDFIRIDDDFSEIGPISGLYKGLIESDTNSIFTLPCDVPNLSKEFIEYIFSFNNSHYDASIIRDKDGFVHPLLGIYNKSSINIIKNAIESKDYKIMNLLKNLNVNYIDLKYTIFDDKYILKNINTPEDYKSFLENKNAKFFAVSGVKNSGKTTLITKLLERFSLAGYKVGTIKHDGHDFEMDNIGSDTHKHIEAGARGTLIFSKNKFMFLENSNEKDLDFYLDFFKGYDFIILEGFKNSNYPKLEIIRSEISTESVSNKNNLKFLVSDLKTIQNNCELEVLDINNIDKIFETTLNSLLSYS